MAKAPPPDPTDPTWPIGPPGPIADDPAVQVWAWALDGPALDGPAVDDGALSAGERRRADRFRFADDRRRFVAAHAGLRLVLSRVLQSPPAEIAFNEAEHGKPFLAGDNPLGVRFNLSHSGELALLAVARGFEVGVDIELRRECQQTEPIARRHFTPREASALLALNGLERERRFFELWTGKEAVVKLLGSGLSFPLTDFETPNAAGGCGEIQLPTSNPLSLASCRLERLTVAPGYEAALALPSQCESRLKTWRLAVDESRRPARRR